MTNGDDSKTRQPDQCERDPILQRLLELGRVTELAVPRPGLTARIGARLDDRVLCRQSAFILATTGLLAVAGLVFWWRADADLASAIGAQITDVDGIEP
jgi:hypothetical protein